VNATYASKQIPLILGCPFLARAKATINCRSGVIDVSIMNMRVMLNIFKASSQPVFEDEFECFFVDVIDEMIEEALPTIPSSGPLGAYLSHRDLRLFDLGSIIDEMDSTLDSTPHLESSPYCPLVSLFLYWLVLLCHLLLCLHLNLS